MVPDLRDFALAAVVVYPAARARLRELSVPPAALFADAEGDRTLASISAGRRVALHAHPLDDERETYARLADVLAEDDATIGAALDAIGRGPRVQAVLARLDRAAAALDRSPRGEAWAVRCVERYAATRSRRWLPIILHWGGDAVEQGWAPRARVRAIVARAFAIADGEGIGGVR